jgi:hypothetical protein
VDPGVDDWKLGKPVEGMPIKKTWQSERVTKDVRARMANFTESQQQQWHALFQFHELYDTADAVPTLPINLTSPSGDMFTMESGSPVDWTESWRELAWRFDRPHQPRSNEAPNSADTANGAESHNGTASQSHKPVDLINGVTGGNLTKLTRKHALAKRSVVLEAAALGSKQITTVAIGELYFAVSDAADGELFVKIVHTKSMDASSSSCEASRLQRSETDFKWKETPTFKWSADAKVENISFTSLLPVPVMLTKGTEKEYVETGNARVTKAGTKLLHAYVAQHRHELLASEPEPETALNPETLASTGSSSSLIPEDAQMLRHLRKLDGLCSSSDSDSSED